MLKLLTQFIKNEDGFLQFLAPVLGGILGASASRSAADTQAAAADRSAQLQKEMFDTTSGYFKPYRKAGENALRTYVDQVGTDFTQTPGYQFGLDQGLQAIEGSAAARGNLMSGATLQSLQEYGQDYATQAYDNWLNRVGGIMSTGQASAGQQAALGQNFANAQGNIFAQKANAQAAGTMGAYNALAPVATGVAGYMADRYQQQQQQSGAPFTSPRPQARPF